MCAPGSYIISGRLARAQDMSMREALSWKTLIIYAINAGALLNMSVSRGKLLTIRRRGLATQGKATSFHG